jgi:phytoene desaturase
MSTETDPTTEYGADPVLDRAYEHSPFPPRLAGDGDGDPLAGRSVTVVGGGFGGLSTACYLADLGAAVTVVEKNDRLGGAAGRIERDGFRFDTGPSWYLMPDVFERFFAHFDRRPGDYYDLERLDPHYRAFFKDGDRVEVTADRDQQRALFESYEDGAGETLERYLDRAAESYEVGMDAVVYRRRDRLRDFLDPTVARAARGIDLLGTMDEYVASYFEHPKLRQLLQYTLVFLGGAPHNTPALYSLMSHVDLNMGVYHPVGGVASVVDGLADLARELGVSFSTGRAVTGIEGRRGGFEVETGGDPLLPDLVVSNANPAHTERELLPPDRREYGEDYWDSRTYAPSAFMLYLGVEGDVDPLAHHTLVLPEDWDPHFEAIFEDPAWPEDPAYYLCVPSKTDDTVAPDGHHAVVVLVPIAAGLDDDPGAREWFRDRVLADVAEYAGVDLRDRIVVEERAAVSEFADRLNAPRGTALGLAHTLRQTGPLRPSRRSSAVDGLYYAGGFTAPGIGVPMTLLSGEQTAAAIEDDETGGGLLASLL